MNGGMLLSKKKKIILIVLSLVVLVATFFGGQTFSKYVTEVNGKGIANVAKWNFKVNESEEQIQTINLNSTIDNNTLIDNKIAPGTSGDFEIRLDATGAEVGINYIITFLNESNKPQNLVFTFENNKFQNLKDIEGALKGTIPADDTQKEKVFNIHWEWPYETGTDAELVTNDKIDTQNGKEIQNYTFDVLVEGVQAIPQAS